jgi:hypothetical protein
MSHLDPSMDEVAEEQIQVWANELLRGRYEPCPAKCDKGISLRIHDEFELCSICNGYGTITRPKYVEACKALGIEESERDLAGGMDAVWKASEQLIQQGSIKRMTLINGDRLTTMYWRPPGC